MTNPTDPPRAAPDLDAIERAAREFRDSLVEFSAACTRDPLVDARTRAAMDRDTETRAAFRAAVADPEVVLALVREARDAARLRDIIRPGDAAAYEEGMAALTARAETAEAALARHEGAPEPARDPGARD